jgi:hypothetical protein
MTRRADFMLAVPTNSIPEAYNRDCVPQNCAARLVMANTFRCFKSGVLTDILSHHPKYPQ